MKEYAVSVYILLIVILISLVFCIIVKDYKICYDIGIGIFVSSIVSMILSIIGYFVNKKRTIKKYKGILYNKLKYINAYVYSWNIEKKAKYFIDYYSNDLNDLLNAYNEIYFICKREKHKEKYYKPYIDILDLSQKIYDNYYDLVLYLNGTGKSENGILITISELENLIINKDDDKITNKFVNNMKEYYNYL